MATELLSPHFHLACVSRAWVPARRLAAWMGGGARRSCASRAVGRARCPTRLPKLSRKPLQQIGKTIGRLECPSSSHEAWGWDSVYPAPTSEAQEPSACSALSLAWGQRRPGRAASQKISALALTCRQFWAAQGQAGQARRGTANTAGPGVRQAPPSEDARGPWDTPGAQPVGAAWGLRGPPELPRKGSPHTHTWKH